MHLKRLFIFDHAAYLPDTHAPQRHFQISKHLVGRQVHVTLIGSGFDHRSKRQIAFRGLSLWQDQVVDGVRYVWLRLPRYSGFLARLFNMFLYPPLAILCFLTGYLGRADCVVGSSPHLFAPLAARVVSSLSRARFVFEVRDLWPDSIIDVLNVSKGNIMVRLMRLVERYLFSSADIVVSVLPGIAEYVKDKNMKLKQPPVWIPNGAALSDVPLPGPADDIRPRLVYFGAIGPANQLNVLLDVWAEVEKLNSRVCLEIIGDGPSKRNLVAQGQALGLLRVAFREFYQSKRDLYAEVGASAGYVLVVPDRPIYRYGVSMNKIPEYLALGGPLIYLGAGLDAGVAGQPFVLVERNLADVKKVAGAVVNFIENQHLAQFPFRIEARKTAQITYSFEVLADRYYSVCFPPLGKRGSLAGL